MEKGNARSAEWKAKRMFSLFLNCMASNVKLSELPQYRQKNAFSLKEIFAEVKEDSPIKTRRFGVYIINHGYSIMCPFLLV